MLESSNSEDSFSLWRTPYHSISSRMEDWNAWRYTPTYPYSVIISLPGLLTPGLDSRFAMSRRLGEFQGRSGYFASARSTMYTVLASRRDCKVVMCTLVQALRLCTGRTAHTGSRGIAVLYSWPQQWKGVRGQRHAPAALYPRERTGGHCTGCCVGPRAGLDRCGKSRLPPGFDPRTVQPVASPYTDWATRPTGGTVQYHYSIVSVAVLWNQVITKVVPSTTEQSTNSTTKLGFGACSEPGDNIYSYDPFQHL